MKDSENEDTILIIFEPDGRRVAVSREISILEAARKAGNNVRAVAANLTKRVLVRTVR